MSCVRGEEGWITPIMMWECSRMSSNSCGLKSINFVWKLPFWLLLQSTTVFFEGIQKIPSCKDATFTTQFRSLVQEE